MTCEEFQRVLPYIIETGGNAAEDHHLRGCPICSDLVQDLRYIVDQAKLLVPMEDPSPRVWNGIKQSLEREGMIKPARARGRLLGPIPWMAALGAMILVSFGAFLVERGRQQQPGTQLEEEPPVVRSVSLNTIATEQDDDQLLQHVAAARPASSRAYESNLKQVNASIAEAKKTLQQDPDDGDARQSLHRAYGQKAMMYEMATRSLP
jgi:hypothetical protein